MSLKNVHLTLQIKIFRKCLKGLIDLIPALSILPTKIPLKICHIINNDANWWFQKPLRKFQKELLKLHLLLIGIFAGTCCNRACIIQLFVLVMSRMRSRVNPHSIVS